MDTTGKEPLTHDAMAALLVSVAGVYPDDLKAFPGHDPRALELELLALYSFTVDFSVQLLLPKGPDTNRVLEAFWARIRAMCGRVSATCWNTVESRVAAYADAVNSRRSENYVKDIGVSFARALGADNVDCANRAVALHAARARAVDALIKSRPLASA